jgi:hypothetical protein
VSEQLGSLQQRVSGLERKIGGLEICCAALMVYLFLSATGHAVKAATQPDML